MADPEVTRVELLRAFRAARADGDVAALVAVALRLPSVLQFGPDPGQIPALLHEALLAADRPEDRARLAAATARAWVYGGDAVRAMACADEAERCAGLVNDPAVEADVLDAALAARWGPDYFGDRVELAARLGHAAGRVSDPEVRLSAVLWQLTTAWEQLDVIGIHRRLRSLDRLAEESGSVRVAFFAASRRAMHAFAVGDMQGGEAHSARSETLGQESGEPDAEAVRHTLRAYRARLVGDAATMLEEAAAAEGFAMAEGVPSVQAEAAVWWLAGGDRERAGLALDRLVVGSVDAIPRDVDFLLILAAIVHVAAALGRVELASEGAELLLPFSGRAVVNAGAVSFLGVVDDYVFQARSAAAAPDTDRWRDAAANAYRRLGAPWWLEQLGAPAALGTAAPVELVVHLYRRADGMWSVGEDGAAVLPALRGLEHLRVLLARPGVDVAAATLVSVGRAGAVGVDSDAGPVLDDAAIAAYRGRLVDLDEDLDEAVRWSDDARTTRLQLEREALIDEITSATGLGGRQRRVASTHERARVAVRKAITAAVDRIAEADPATAHRLRTTVHTGSLCRYDEDPIQPVRWILDTPSP